MTENTAWAVGSTECEPIIIWADGTPIAKVYNSEANAHLIAAAPDLYEALRNARAALARYVSVEEPVFVAVTEAIAKAEGRDHD